MSDYVQGVTGAPYKVIEDFLPKDATLSQYVMTAEYLLSESKEHGLVETNLGFFLISTPCKIDKYAFEAAAEAFRDSINKYERRQYHGD